LAGSSRTCRARRHALGILPNGITPAEQAVTNEIVARLRDHALSRAPRTNGLSAFSTRHVPRYLYPVPPFHRKLLPVIPPQGGVPALCRSYALGVGQTSCGGSSNSTCSHARAAVDACPSSPRSRQPMSSARSWVISAFPRTRLKHRQRARRRRSPICSQTSQPEAASVARRRGCVCSASPGCVSGLASREFLLTGALSASYMGLRKTRGASPGRRPESDRGGYVNFSALMIPMPLHALLRGRSRRESCHSSLRVRPNCRTLC